MNRKLVGVDVGGTFTDVFVFNQDTGEIAVSKVPSTRDDQSKGFIAGIQAGARNFADISTIVHGTTVGTNALLERKGAKTGIITTVGFRDVLEMRRRDRPTTWGLWGMFEPVVPRNLRLEVRERTLADGTILEAVNLEDVREAAQHLLAEGCEAVCIFFINGYANLSNEIAAAAAVREVWPTPYVTTATEILPEIREFERVSTATLNAYLQPVVASYLDRLKNGLQQKDAQADVLIVQSNGGVMDVATASCFPVRTALSGPAAGVIAARHIAEAAGFSNIITCDMGGTSFDVSLVTKGASTLAAQTEIDFGMVVRTPMVEISTIGAGGGSISHIDAGGLLAIGPQSAGSDPGPVAYGLGNDAPTVTDANLILGRINPDRPIGGKLDRLDIDAAKTAVEVKIAKPLGLTVMQAAEAIVKVANAKMAGAIRLVSVERGHDPKNFACMPFGGGGALHTGALMQEIGLGAAIVPRFPGVTSAFGCVVADMRLDIVQTVNQLLAGVDTAALAERMETQAQKFEVALADSEADLIGTTRVFELDMLYLGQTHTVTVPLSTTPQDTCEVSIRADFEKKYTEIYGRLLPGVGHRIVNLRVAVIGHRPEIDMVAFAPKTDKKLEQCELGQRMIWHDGAEHSATIYERLDLPVGADILGPAILEQPDTTIFIDPGLTGVVDGFGNIIIRWVDK
ncbi:MAG: hydantoinase/oxoprolinase family protein [Amylibacter sp.]|nr:hydantoinase/oxoprolinase family protein [Amylibacter sp.]MDG1236460.1 hydantoinase/oxoprolinase family protein [Amylibacter sp.]MDG1999514.1 hydantoinase/oxoprolinase family protein [Amylibacter sp.]